MGLFSGATEKKTQLYIYDDGSVEFRKLPFEDSCLVEKKDGQVVKAWKHYYGNEFRFDGYGKLRADGVTLGFGRDFILDPFNKVPVTSHTGGKPTKGDEAIKRWTAQIAESQRYKISNKPGNMLLLDKVTMWLGAGFILELILVGIRWAWL